MKYDIKIAEEEFSATKLTFEAKTAKGQEFFTRTFGLGVVSVTMPKSKGEAFIRHIGQQGLTVN